MYKIFETHHACSMLMASYWMALGAPLACSHGFDLIYVMMVFFSDSL